MKLQVVLEPSEEGGYTVYVPSLPGCVSEGDTEEEALVNIREAIELYLEQVDDDRRRRGCGTRTRIVSTKVPSDARIPYRGSPMYPYARRRSCSELGVPVVR